ncbi:MAG TPA: heme biosynthesis protein HemY [Desulfurivibrio alkaliphilus]|uniref:Heme biosynthesis protein HemY n=1 Tax=Desulfurivibrio alkaliphilus TaxID=427923 RepID=A0A7C2TH74_9BACT|nr:heme biosynthesis protein HemY [Desulfurivibrio alkaliphilus]
MLKVTEAALVSIREYLDKNKVEDPLRVVLENGCAGPNLVLTLDGQRDGDRIFREGDITFLVEPNVLELTGEIQVDFVKPSSGCGCGGGGFRVTSEKQLIGGGCGSSCATGSCGC